jgi:hypothetical protein
MLKSWQRIRLDHSEMFNWRQFLTGLGWAMAMTDPTCYSYYLASRIDSTNGKGARDIAQPRMALRSLRDGDRTRPTVVQNAREGSRQLI